MSDPLDLIAEARRRQEAAERDRDYWKEKAEFYRQRCRRVIDMAKLRPVPTPTVHEGGVADWEQLMRLVHALADVISDPYARYADDDEPFGMTHDTAKNMMAFRLQRMIEDAVKKGTK